MLSVNRPFSVPPEIDMVELLAATVISPLAGVPAVELAPPTCDWPVLKRM